MPPWLAWCWQQKQELDKRGPGSLHSFTSFTSTSCKQVPTNTTNAALSNNGSTGTGTTTSVRLFKAPLLQVPALKPAKIISAAAKEKSGQVLPDVNEPSTTTVACTNNSKPIHKRLTQINAETTSTSKYSLKRKHRPPGSICQE